MNIDFPPHVGADARTAAAPDAKHIRDMIELFLFTQQGERPMRPDFGSGLLQFVFAPNSPELAAALQLSARAGLERWLGDVVDVRAFTVTTKDAALVVSLSYAIRATGDIRNETFERALT